LVKVQLNVRVDYGVIQLLDYFKKNRQVSKTSILETAVKEFFERNKEEIVSEELQVILSYMKIETARTHTKLEMRKATFVNNAVRRLKKMIRDGLRQESFDHLIMVWCKEAEANGVEKEQFLESLYYELQKNTGSGINELN